MKWLRAVAAFQMFLTGRIWVFGDIVAAIFTAVFAPFAICAHTVTTRIPTGLRPDSVPWRPVIQYAISSLSGDILRAASDPTARPWRIVLPDSGPEWAQLHRHLVLALRAREPRSGEIDLDELTIGPMEMRGDSAWVRLTRTHTRQCANSGYATGYGNVENVLVFRFREQFWSAARSLGVLHGDRAGCP